MEVLTRLFVTNLIWKSPSTASMILMSFANVFYGIFSIFKQVIPDSVCEKALLLGCYAHTWCIVKYQDISEYVGSAPNAQISGIYEVMLDHTVKTLKLGDVAYRSCKRDSPPDGESLRIIVLYNFALSHHKYAVMYKPDQLHQISSLIPYSLEEVQEYRQQACTIFPYAHISLQGREITDLVCQYAGPKQNFHDDVASTAFAGNLMVDFDKLEVVTGDSTMITGIDLVQHPVSLKELGRTSQDADADTDSDTDADADPDPRPLPETTLELSHMKQT